MSKRFIYVAGFLFVCALLMASLYLQFFDGMEPCPLCTLQRICFVLLGACFFMGIWAANKRFAAYIISFFSAAFSVFGIIFSGRQIWLQHIPQSGNTECGVSIQYMLKVLPFNEVMQKIFSGSAECSQRGFSFLSLDMATWSLIWFVTFLIISLYLLLKKA